MKDKGERKTFNGKEQLSRIFPKNKKFSFFENLETLFSVFLLFKFEEIGGEEGLSSKSTSVAT